MIIGVGCDIVATDRIANQDESFCKKVLTPKELDIYVSYNPKRRVEFLAGRFAAKEAIFKAYNDAKIISNIEVLNDPAGKPYCDIKGVKIHLSISHDENYAIAYAICEKI